MEQVEVVEDAIALLEGLEEICALYNRLGD
jgi:hypothetical protein